MRKPTKITLNHQHHGVFQATIAQMNAARTASNEDLIAMIGDAYCDVRCSCGRTARPHAVCWPPEYWQHQPRIVLEIVVCDLYQDIGS